MIVGCYSLDLYCDNRECKSVSRFRMEPDVYTGRTFAGCSRKAKKDGWKIDSRRRWCICPACVAAGVKTVRIEEPA